MSLPFEVIPPGKERAMEPDRKVDVLLVDDQPNNLLALEAVLGGMGLNLVTARSGAEALAQKAEELARTVAERLRAEEQLRDRARQQAIVVELGQKALAGTELAA